MSAAFGTDILTVAALKEVLDTWDSERLLLFAKELVETFIGANFAGVVLDAGEDQFHFSHALVEEMCQLLSTDLSFSLYQPFKFARCKHLLWIAKLILIDRSNRIQDSFEKILWTTRCIHLWQDLLDEPAIRLKELYDQQAECDLACTSTGFTTAEYLLERMYFYLIYYEYDKANDCLLKALEHADLNIELTGAAGKRTKFQSNDIPQLIVNASTSGDSENFKDNECSCCELPQNVNLNDDTLLETVQLTGDSNSSKKKKLHEVQTACILAACQLSLKNQHKDDLLIEKCLAYVDEVIAQRSNWATYVCALMLRCNLEKHRRRRVERACSQAEVIAKILDGIDDSVPSAEKRHRIRLIMASGLQPSWCIHFVHAEILRSLGCTAEALRIYERFEAWDSVVDCYKSLGQLEKAERIVRQLLEKDSSNAIYYCLLGDITLQAEYYKKAIEVSGERCARAYKALGSLMLIRKQFDVAFDNFKRSLELQPIQLGVWFNLGHCAWRLERYQEAASAYHRCVQLEPDHFEAWNNLAAAYTRLRQKPRARKVLQEALKFNYDHANMWENYLLICMDTGEFAQAILAFHRLLDLRKKQEDDEVIELLSKQISRMVQESDDAESQQLLAEMCKLLGRLTATTTCSGKVWRCYALLKKPSDEGSVDDYEKYLSFLERANRVEQNKQDWQKDEEVCARVLNGVADVVEGKMKLAERKNSDRVVVKSSARMMLKPLIAVIEREYGTNADFSQNATVKESLQRAVELLSIASS